MPNPGDTKMTFCFTALCHTVTILTLSNLKEIIKGNWGDFSPRVYRGMDSALGAVRCYWHLVGKGSGTLLNILQTHSISLPSTVIWLKMSKRSQL